MYIGSKQNWLFAKQSMAPIARPRIERKARDPTFLSGHCCLRGLAAIAGQAAKKNIKNTTKSIED
jgi:hypothetical protein